MTDEKNYPIETAPKRSSRKFWGWVLLLFLLLGSYEAGVYQGKKNGSLEDISPIEKTIILNKDLESNTLLDFSLFWKVWDLLKEKYVDSEKLDANKLFYGAINGMLAATGDPYTAFLSPQENKKFREEIKGSFEGIGAEVGMRGGVVTIIAPLGGSPAEKSGLRAGDKVLKVDGQSTSELTLDETVDRMRGKKGTEVTLTIFREGEQETREIKIVRDTIVVKSAKLEFRDNNVAYLELSQFGDTSVREFGGAAREIEKKKPRALILDLRNNPGGYLDASVDIASWMLSKGATVVSEMGKDTLRETFKARGGDLLSGIKTVILINQGSASASEILAGALKDNRENVTIVGEKSYGKGSVQEFLELPGGSAAKITVAKWLTPKGEQINDKGIAPDVEVKMTAEDYDNNRDPQLEKALEIANQ